MADATGIQWADATFNPWVGCEKVSPGCAHCYAETLVTGRMGRAGTWGVAGTRQRTSPSNWKKPLRWARLAREGKLPNGRENPDGHRPRVFCASLADVFEDRPELDEWRLDLFALIKETPELDWLVLTKRPEHARDWLAELGGGPGFGWTSWTDRPFPNVWLGVSIENARHTYRADVLREIPAAVRFISAEPLLGSLFEAEGFCRKCGHGFRAHGANGCDWEISDYGQMDCGCTERGVAPLDLTGIDWVIVGGESGPGARPFHLEHAREIIRAARGLPQRACDRCSQGVMDATNPHLVGGCSCPCHAATAVFVKQLGAKPMELSGDFAARTGLPQLDLAHIQLRLRDRKGGDWDEWPADLRIREFPR